MAVRKNQFHYVKRPFRKGEKGCHAVNSLMRAEVIGIQI